MHKAKVYRINFLTRNYILGALMSQEKLGVRDCVKTLFVPEYFFMVWQERDGVSHKFLIAITYAWLLNKESLYLIHYSVERPILLELYLKIFHNLLWKFEQFNLDKNIIFKIMNPHIYLYSIYRTIVHQLIFQSQSERVCFFEDLWSGWTDIRHTTYNTQFTKYN